MLPLLDAYLAVQFSRNFNTALEIGVYKGGWAFNLTRNIPGIFFIGIDPYPNLEAIKYSFINKRDQLGFNEVMHLYRSYHELQSSCYSHLTFDIIHCDGAHTQSSVNKDLINVLPMLTENGLLVIDDLFYHSYPGVTAAAFSFIEKNQLAPFLFTEKKLYVCRANYYQYYLDKTISFLNSINLKYEQDEKEGSGLHYIQSNSIFNYNLIITSESPTREEHRSLIKALGAKVPFSMQLKSTAKFILPPILIVFLQSFKAKLVSSNFLRSKFV
jgi:hypothetical protein